MITVTPLELASLAINQFGAMQKVHELAALIAMVDELKPSIIVEIGVGKGGTTWVWSKLSSVRKIVCIDLPGGPFGGESHEQTQTTLKYVTDNSGVDVHYIAGNSQNSKALEALENSLDNEPIDFLLIDGDHSYGGVKTDYLTYSTLVRDDGVIALHDICVHPTGSGCDVVNFWEELRDALNEKHNREFATKMMKGEIVADQEDEYGPHAVIPKCDKYVEFIQEPINWGGIGVIKK